MKDFSFIRLEPDFLKAKTESLPPMADIVYFDQIYLNPTQTYLQITNTPLGIAFDGNYKVEIVDCCDEVLSDITENVAISEFTDNNGLPQIAFEIAYINQNLVGAVYLKFTHTVSDYIWYSNAVNITDYREENTTRFDYRCFSDFHGTAYNRADFFQSIGLKTRFEDNDSESTSSQYTSINGKKVTSRLIETEFEKYIFEGIDNFTYRRFNKLLTNDVVYAKGNRITDKLTNTSTNRLGDTNTFDIDYKVAINYNETFTPAFQIFTPLELITKSPFGSYTLVGLPSNISASFNRNITLNTGTVKIFDSSLSPTPIFTFTEGDVNITDSLFTLDITGFITTNDTYRIEISQGLFTSVIGENNEFISWEFTVSDGDFLLTDFNNPDFFTT